MTTAPILDGSAPMLDGSNLLQKVLGAAMHPIVGTIRTHAPTMMQVMLGSAVRAAYKVPDALVNEVCRHALHVLLGSEQRGSGAEAIERRRNLLAALVVVMQADRNVAKDEHYAAHGSLTWSKLQVVRRTASKEVMDMVKGLVASVRPVLPEAAGHVLPAFVAEGSPPHMLHALVESSSEARATVLMRLWAVLSGQKAGTDSSETTTVDFCGTVHCVCSVAVDLLLAEFCDVSAAAAGSDRDTLLSLAGQVYAVCVQRCLTAGNLLKTALLRYHITATWTRQRCRREVLVADVDFLAIVDKCCQRPTCRLWDVQVTLLALRAILHTCSEVVVLGRCMHVWTRVGYVPLPRWDSFSLAAAELAACGGHKDLYPAGNVHMADCIVASFYRAVDLVLPRQHSLAAMALVETHVHMWGTCGVIRWPEVCKRVMPYAATATHWLCKEGKGLLTTHKSLSLSLLDGCMRLWLAMNVGGASVQMAAEVGGDDTALHAQEVVHTMVEERIAAAWLDLLQVLEAQGMDPFDKVTVVFVALLTTEHCQALVPEGAAFVQLSAPVVDKIVSSAAFFDGLIMDVVTHEAPAVLGLHTIADLWHRVSNDAVRAKSQAQLIAFVTALSKDRMEAGLQAVFRLLPDCNQWTALWHTSCIEADLRFKYRAWLAQPLISADMGQDMWVFWGEVLCTRAVGYVRVMRVWLQRMTFEDAAAGFKRHKVQEAIQPKVRGWAKKVAKKTPGQVVHRDPVRVLANFALDNWCGCLREDAATPVLVARACPGAFYDPVRADVLASITEHAATGNAAAVEIMHCITPHG